MYGIYTTYLPLVKRLARAASDFSVTHKEVGAVHRAGAAADFDIAHKLLELSQVQAKFLKFFKMCGDVDMAALACGPSD